MTLLRCALVAVWAERRHEAQEMFVGSDQRRLVATAKRGEEKMKGEKKKMTRFTNGAIGRHGYAIGQ
jgi:hypothetical protein